jgi:hypothetical protein
MSKVVIWDTQGRILHVCDDDNEAADVIEENGYTELYSQYGQNGDKNIAVSEF